VHASAGRCIVVQLIRNGEKVQCIWLQNQLQ
jgi:hypothetical protein